MHPCVLMAVLASLVFIPEISAQISIDVNIAPTPGQNTPTLDLNTLNQQGLNGISGVVPGTVDTQLVVQQCGKGTYSLNQECIPCSAGTSSQAVGASDPATCVPCGTGAYAPQQSSVCTNCVVNTFSVTPMAASVSSCLACPPHTTSGVKSDSVEDCICNPGYFLSDNILSVSNGLTYDYIPPGVSDSLAFLSAVSIDVPSVNC